MNHVPKFGNRVTETPCCQCHLGWTQFEKSVFIAVFYWLVNDPPVINPLALYLIRKGTDSASFWGRYFRCLRAFCGLKLRFFASFWLKCVLATRDVCKRPRHLYHWNQHSISDPVIPHIAVYNAYGFVTKQINTSTVFVHVSDHVIGTGQMANTSRRKSAGTCNANIKTTIRMQRKCSFYSYKFQEDTFRDCGEVSDWNTVK